MKTSIVLVLVAAGLLAGCADEKPAPPPPPLPEAPAAPAAAPTGEAIRNGVDELFAGPDTTMLATVNGKTMTLGRAKQEMEARFARMKDSLSEEEFTNRRGQMLSSIVDQFVMRALLVEEADRRDIQITPEEEAEAFDQVRKRLPQGQTLEEAMKESPLGEERMREEVLVGARINKLLRAVVPEDPVITEAEIEEFVENNSKVTMPETVSARHILIKTTGEDTEETKAEKKARIEDLRKQALEGADFAELAAGHSECPSSKRGGDLGMFGRGQMVKPFEDAAFSQEIGTVGEVVETKFGYHVILVTDKKAEGEVPREQIERALKNRKSKEAYEQFLIDLRDNADIKFNSAVTQSASRAAP